jgi:hypothetical protein
MNRKREVLFWLLVAVQLLAGAWLVYRPPATATDFARALGHALIIAGLLAFTVDLYLKARLLKEVAGDVSKFLVGYSLPVEVRDRIQDLMHERLIRRDFLLRIRLSRAGSPDGFVKRRIEASDEAENISNEVYPFVDHLEYEKHDQLTMVEMRCDSNDPKAQYCFSGPGLVKEKEAEPGLMQAAGRKVKIVPRNREKGLKYRFTAKWEVILPDNYSDIISFIKPTINARVEVESDPEFRFTLSPTAQVSHDNCWEYHRLFLPQQHLRYRWEPVRTGGKK